MGRFNIAVSGLFSAHSDIFQAAVGLPGLPRTLPVFETVVWLLARGPP